MSARDGGREPAPAGASPSTAEVLEILQREHVAQTEFIRSLGTEMRRVLFVFLSVSAAAAGAILGIDELAIDRDIYWYLLLTASQLLFLLAVVAAVLLHDQQSHSGYVAALEERINSIGGQPLITWNCRTVGQVMDHHTRAFWFGTLLVAAWFVVLYVALGAILQPVFGTVSSVVMGAELVIVFYLLREGAGRAKDEARVIARADYEALPEDSRDHTSGGDS